MADNQYCRVGEKHALAYDRFQWVLQRRKLVKGEEKFSAVAFTDGTKYRLFAMMIRYGVSKDDALDVCEQLPETFIEFLADRGSQSGVGAGHGAISASEVPTHHPETRDAPVRAPESVLESIDDQAV